MVPEDDARQTLEYENYFIIEPYEELLSKKSHKRSKGGRPCPDGFQYSSDKNTSWLSEKDIRDMIG